VHDRPGESQDVLFHLDRALGRLPARLRDAVVLRHLEGLSPEETARQLGCTVDAASTRVSRCLDILRRRLVRLGFGGTALSLAVLLDQTRCAAMPADFTARTLSLCAGTCAAGTSAFEILKGMEAMTLWKKVKIAAACVLVSLATAVGSLLVADQAGPPAPAVAKSGAGAPAAAPREAAGAPASVASNGEYRMAVLNLTLNGQPAQLYVQMRDGKAGAALLALLGKDEKGRVIQERGVQNWGKTNNPMPDLSRITMTGDRLQGAVSVAGFGEMAFEGVVNGGAVTGTFAFKGGGNGGEALSGSVLSDTEMAKTNAIAPDLGWPALRGPYANHRAQETRHELVDDIRLARLVWFSEEKIPAGAGAELQGGTLYGFSIFNSPVIGEGKVFFNTAFRTGEAMGDPVTREGSWTGSPQPILADEVVMAIDAASGKTLWKQVFKEKGINLQGKKHVQQGGTGCYYKGRYYAVTSTMKIYCFDARTGAIVWESDYGKVTQDLAAAIPAAIASKKMIAMMNTYPVLGAAGGVVFPQLGPQRYGGADNPVFDAETGQNLWKVPSDNRLVHWSCQGKDYLVKLAGDVTCYELRTGKVVWTGSVTAAKGELAMDGNILIGSTDKTIVGYKLDAQGIRKIWEADGAGEVFKFADPQAWNGGPTRRTHFYGCMFHNNRVIVRWDAAYDRGPECQKLAVLDAETGKVIKSGIPGLGGRTHDVVANDLLFTAPDASHAAMPLRTINLNTFTEMAPGKAWLGLHVSTSGYDIYMDYPVVDGRYFVRGRERIFCYDLRKPQGGVTASEGNRR
jgi:outer membrane protein assembly factor BamB